MGKTLLQVVIVFFTLHHQGGSLKCYNCISSIQPLCKEKYAAHHFLLVQTPTNGSVCYSSRQKVTSGNSTMYVTTRGFLYTTAEARVKCTAIEAADAGNLCEFCKSGDGCNWRMKNPPLITTTTRSPKTPTPHNDTPTSMAEITLTIALLVLLVAIS